MQKMCSLYDVPPPRQSLVGGAGRDRPATPLSVIIGLQISRTLTRGNQKEHFTFTKSNSERSIHHVC